MTTTQKGTAAPKGTVAPKGILPDTQLRALVQDGYIRATPPILEKQYQPASLDLRLGDKAYRLRASFLPDRDMTTSRLIQTRKLYDVDLKGGAVLEKGIVYIVPLAEALHLEGKDIYGLANPKSSIGRLDVFVRLVCEQADGFDEIPKGYSGPLYLEISPRSFPITVRTGSSLTQLRLFHGGAQKSLVLSDTQLQALHDTTPVLFADSDAPLLHGLRHIHEGLALSVNLKPMGGGPIGYRARRDYAGVVDVDKPQTHRIKDFWEELRSTGGRDIVLDPLSFYILVSRERIAIPPDYAAEMVPINPLLGEFRAHYAGFFDPGFGWTKDRPTGAHTVLEVRSMEVPFLLRHGQLIGHLKFLPMLARPKHLYGADLQSHYQGQSLRLSKHFC